MACTQFQHTSPTFEINMEVSEVPSSNAVDYFSGSDSPDLEHHELDSDIRGRRLPSKALWQRPRRRSSSCHSSDDAISHYDSSSSMSSKYNSDSDADLSAGIQSPATSWSSHCDEACDHGASPAQQEPSKTQQQTSSLREAVAGGGPMKLTIDTQNLPPWDAMFPDWYQCASPGPIRQLGASWTALKDTNMQGLWAPPPPPPAAGGLWGM